MNLFCPKCDHLIFGVDACPNCTWRAPAPAVRGEVVWTGDLTAALPEYCHPVVAGERLCIPADRQYVLSISARPEAKFAEPVRRALFGPEMRSMLASAGDLVLAAPRLMENFGSGQTELLGVDPATLDVRWRLSLDASSLSTPVVGEVDGRAIAYVAAADGRVFAIDLAAQALFWPKPVSIPHPSPQPPLFLGGSAPSLLVPSDSAELACLDARTGKVRWRYTGRAGVASSAWFHNTPVRAGDLAIAPNWSGSLTALPQGTGKPDRPDTETRGIVSVPAVVGGRILVCVKGAGRAARELLALDAASGAELGRLDLSALSKARGGTDMEWGLAAGPGCAWLMSLRMILWVDPATLQIQGQHPSPGSPACAPALSGGVAFFFGQNGAALALRQDDARPAALEGAEAYLARGEFALAALALAHAGDVAGAGRLYEERLGDAERAARLYVAAKAWADAGRAYEKATQIDAADRAMANDAALTDARAALRERAGQFERAGDLREALGQMLEAAADYEKAGKWARAAALYKVLDRPDDEARCNDQTGDWERSAEMWKRRGELIKAAWLYQINGKLRDAAGLYEQARDFATAAGLRERLGEWALAVDDYEQAGRLADAVRCLAQDLKMLEHGVARLKHKELSVRVLRLTALCDSDSVDPAWELAADALGKLVALFEDHGLHPDFDRYLLVVERYAHALANMADVLARRTPGIDNPEAAAIFDQAATAWAGAGNAEAAQACYYAMIRHRHLPYVVAEINQIVHRGASEPMRVAIHNRGVATAANIKLSLSARDDELKIADIGPASMRYLRAGAIDALEFFVNVKDGKTSSFPVTFKLTYEKIADGERVAFEHESDRMACITAIAQNDTGGDLSGAKINIGTIVIAHQIGDSVTVR
jgi:outer membrane protein assembly factor BamB/tetratricopeptide (TPR) repeat protein